MLLASSVLIFEQDVGYPEEPHLQHFHEFFTHFSLRTKISNYSMKISSKFNVKKEIPYLKRFFSHRHYLVE